MKTTYTKLTARCSQLIALCTLFIVHCTLSQALPRSEAQMMQAAAEAINGQRTAMHKAPRKGQIAKLVQKGANIAVVGYEEGGFAIVTADDVLPAVVGYSDKSYDADDLPEGFSWWLDAMSEAADYYVATQTTARIVRPNTSRVQPFVRPLLSTEWGQEDPYNNACPMLPDQELYPRHCVVGCVATATAQILNYHQWPTTGHGTTTLRVPYGSATGTDYHFDFSQCHFDWANMRNTYTPGNYTEAEARAVSDLSHAMGMMAVMQYGLDFSGAISDDAVNGLQLYFGITTATLYSRNDVFGMSENYTEQQWCDMLLQELSDVGPVYYAAADADDQGGHAFVIDGYNEDGLVHVNWGWHGRFDGYYDVSILNPRIYHFSKAQEMILGICPPQKAKGMTQVIAVDEPGMLGDELEAVRTMVGDAARFSAVKVTGPLNADDLHALAVMRELSSIDLGGATLDGDLLPPHAFYGCSNLRTLILPANIRFYGDGALAGCSNLNELSMPEGDGQGYVLSRGVVYTPDMSEVIAVLPTAPDTVTVADGVVRLHDHAFEGCKYVRIVTLPASLQVMGSRALADVLIMRELHLLGNVPAEVSHDTFDGVDPGFLMLYLPAGSRSDYERAEGWRELFRSDNVTEVGTLIRARDITRQYGEDVDDYYFEILGQRVKGVPRLWCEATPTSPAGQYVIHCERGTVEGDDVRFEDALLTVVGGPKGLNDADDAASTFNLGYCGGEVATKSTYGDMGNEYVSAAVYIPASMLGGMGGAEITKIRAGLATRLNIDELTVWVRTSLDGDNLAEGQLNRKQTRVQQGWNEVGLATAYIIKEQQEGLYIGYTYHHTGLANAVSIVGTTPAGTAFFKKNSDAPWQDISTEGAISLEAVVSGTMLAQWDMALRSASLSPDLNAGPTAYKLTADVANMGTSDVNGFDITISTDGLDDVTTHVSQSVASGKMQTVSVITHLSLLTSHLSPLTVAITAIDGGTDANADNNTAEAALCFERQVLLEEFTTENCPNCPDGAETMHTALQMNPAVSERVNIVCHHAAFGTDWLTQQCDEAYTWFFNEGGQTFAPAWMIDRKPYFDSMIASGNRQAIYWPGSEKEFAQMLEGAMAEEPHAQIGATATVADGRINVSVIGLYDEQFSTAGSRLTVYLTEDNIDAHEQQDHNGVVSGFKHQHVIRAYNSTWGVKPAYSQDMTLSYACSFALDPSWKRDDLKVVAVLSNYDETSNLNCIVENSVAVPIVEGSTEGIVSQPHLTSNFSHLTSDSYDLQGRPIGNSRSAKPRFVIIRRADGSVIKSIAK